MNDAASSVSQAGASSVAQPQHIQSTVEEFREAMRLHGLVPPIEPVADGKLHRCDVVGKLGQSDGAYRLSLSNRPHGGFQNWTDGHGWRRWRGKHLGKPSGADAARDDRREADARRQWHAEKEARWERARRRAEDILGVAGPASTDHPYLQRKCISAHGARQLGDRLLIPVNGPKGLQSLQFIHPDGTKRFLRGGRKSAAFYPIGERSERVCIAEGFATGASIFEATGISVLVAFGAGNLDSVARFAAAAGCTDIIVCADDDYGTTGNPGISKAREAAAAVGGVVAIPDFGSERPAGATDFNDLRAVGGDTAVRRCIEAACKLDAVVDPDRCGVLDDGERSDGEARADGEGADREIISRAAALPPLEYDRQRKALARQLRVTTKALDAAVKSFRTAAAEQLAVFGDPDPWPEPVETGALLDEIAKTLGRYVAMDEASKVAVALWVLVTWTVVDFFILPMLAITSPEKRCGKSTLLILLRRLTRRPMLVANTSPAALFRAIEKYAPTLLLDEADAWAKDNEELRGILNAGHTRDTAHVLRADGDQFEPRLFNTFCPKAIAGIGKLADTIEDRSIAVRMRRKSAYESVEQLRQDRLELTATTMRAMRWQADVSGRLRAMDPDVPKCLNDRAADNWRPLLAIADIAGGKWPEIVRTAAVELSASVDAEDSSGVTLLGDIRELFTEEGDRISSSEMVTLLSKLDDRPWAEWRHGKPITTVQLARVLRPFGIRSRNVRINGIPVKGYLQVDFHDAFGRYLSSTVSGSATPLQATEQLGKPLAIAATTSSHVAGSVATDDGDDACVAGVAATTCAQVADQSSENAIKSKVCSAVAGTHVLGDPRDVDAAGPDSLTDYADCL